MQNIEDLFLKNQGLNKHIDFLWAVYNDYEIKKGLKLRKELNLNLQNNIKEFDKLDFIFTPALYKYLNKPASFDNQKPTELKNIYSPLNEEKNSNLFYFFANLIEGKENKKEVIMEWVNEYGLLGHPGDFYAFSMLSNNSWGLRIREAFKRGLIFPLQWFIEQSLKAGYLLKIYSYAQTYNIKKLKELITTVETENNTLLISAKYSFPYEYNNETLPLSDKKIIHFSYHHIHNCIEDYLANISPTIKKIDFNKEDDWKAEIGWSCQSLLNALYLQFIWILTETRKVKTCKVCGKPFFLNENMTDKRKYCPPPPGYKESPCKNKLDDRRNRYKNKIIKKYQEGEWGKEEAIIEGSKITDLPKKIIENWIITK